jgi:hypothetical protein
MFSFVVCSRNSSRVITLVAMRRGIRRDRGNCLEEGGQRRVKPVLYDLILSRPFAGFNSHINHSVLRRERGRGFLHPPRRRITQCFLYLHVKRYTCATWFSTRMTTISERASKRGPSGLIFHVTSRGDESTVCHVPRQKRVGTESNNK